MVYASGSSTCANARHSTSFWQRNYREFPSLGKRGKALEPDGVSFEAVRGILAKGEHWMDRMADMYGEALYKGQMPNTSGSVTTLLAKKLGPSSWGETRPLGKPWPEQGKQTGEVIFALRRISRMALDWGRPVYVLEAFDSVVQARLGELIFKRAAVQGGKPWEARLLLQLVQREDLLIIQTDGGSIPIQQTNGVRQGSPVLSRH